MKQRLSLESANRPRENALGRAVLHACVGLFLLAVVGAVVVADSRSITRTQPESMRLSVRPHEMKIPAKNPKAGEYTLDTVEDVIVTVPPKCAGKHKCPLVVMLPGGGIPARQMTDWLSPVAIKYGMILMTTTKYDVQTMDDALKEILEKYAIDPSKIAIIGRCASGDAGMRFGIDNLDVFSRIASVSGGVSVQGMDAANTTAEFLIDRGYKEVGGSFAAVQALRDEKHPVKQVFAIRGHEHQAEDYDFVGHWLHESWSKKPKNRTAPVAIADPLPLLTEDSLSKLTTFWTEFLKEPKEIRLTARREYLREVIVPVGKERPSVWITDMVAMAKKYPSVAKALKKAGLKAKKADAIRVAIISAMITKHAGEEAGGLDGVSEKNVAFMDEHEAEFKALEEAGIEQPDAIEQVNMTATITHPKKAEDMGAMGIWRTP